ncbi:AbgT family transporter, partial [Streptomyces sp. NPDC002920]
MPSQTDLPAPPTDSPDSGRATPLDRVLSLIERAGNALPNPVVLFSVLFLLLAVASTALDLGGVSVRVPGGDETKHITGLLTGEGVSWLVENLVVNFATFPPIGAVLVLIMVVGLCEKTGLLETLMRATLARVPRVVLPYAVALIASQAHMMSDVAAIVLPPLAALVFKSAGRHPVAGLIGGFACVTAGYAAGFTIGSLDALYVGITQQAASVLPAADGLHIHLLINYFFTAASSLVLATVGGFLISRVLEPRLGVYQGGGEESDLALTPVQRRALLRTALVVLVYLAGVLALWLPEGAPLRGEGGAFVPSPLLSGIVPVLFGAFLLAGLTYGFGVKQLTSAEDVTNAVTESVRTMSGYLVMMFVAAQVIALFTWSNVGVLLAVKGAALFDSLGVTGFWAILVFVLLVSCLNLFILSGSALWSLVGPVFVPAFMLMGMSPALTQAAFRIGDSATGVITPMNPYVFLIL